MKLIDDLLDLEMKYKLFEIKDKHGHVVWESIRYIVSAQIVRNSRGGFLPEDNKFNSSILFAIKRLFFFLRYLVRYRKRRVLMILTSRSLDNGFHFDTISDNLYEVADPKDVFLIETTFNWNNQKYKYKTVCPSILTIMMRLKKDEYDFSEIFNLLKYNYPNIDFDVKEWNYMYKCFRAQYTLYNFLFKTCHFEKVFFVQNGIFKGIIAAAKKNGVETYELQHGQISKNHLMYSYKYDCIKCNNLYNPNYLLTFGPMWLKDVVYPGVGIIPIGNDYLSIPSNSTIKTLVNKKRILVVSSVYHADALIKLVKEISDAASDFYFYYKLHPDEYKNEGVFLRVFSDQPNVKVVKNQYAVKDLLLQVEATLAVQSTVMVESLNAGRPVIVYRALDYEVMDFLFNNPGVCFVDDSQSFIRQYPMLNKAIPSGGYYISFDKKVGKQVMDIS